MLAGRELTGKKEVFRVGESAGFWFGIGLRVRASIYTDQELVPCRVYFSTCFAVGFCWEINSQNGHSCSVDKQNKTTLDGKDDDG